jgi:hypothetical protein
MLKMASKSVKEVQVAYLVHDYAVHDYAPYFEH